MRRSQQSLQSAERAGQRSSASAGGNGYVGSRAAREAEVSFIHGLSWNAGAFRAENPERHFIRLVGSDRYRLFQELRENAREGFDADLNGRIGRVTWGLDYTFLEATYQSAETVQGRPTTPAIARWRDFRDWMGISTFTPEIGSR